MQENVRKTIQKEISISIKSECKKITILCLLISMLVNFGQLITLPTYTIKEAIGFIHIVCCAYLYMGAYHLNCDIIYKTSDFILREFKLVRKKK